MRSSTYYLMFRDHFFSEPDGDEGGGTGDSGAGGDGGAAGGDSGAAGDGGAGGTDGGGADDGSKGDKADDNAGLKSALEKERTRAKAAEKQAKELQKYKDDQEAKDKSDVEKAAEKATKAEDKVGKLAARLLRNEVNQAIVRAATALKFTDPEDAVAMLDRDSIVAAQDEDDPSDIEIDVKSVEKAVKALADRKKHLLAGAGESDGKSGSSFGGGGGNNQQQTAEQLKAKYPALR